MPEREERSHTVLEDGANWARLTLCAIVQQGSPDTVINLHSPQTELETVIMSMQVGQAGRH